MSYVGQAVTFSVQFTDRSGSAANPTTTTLTLLEELTGEERRWTYDASPVEGTHYPEGASAIETTATGAFELVYIPRTEERHTGQWDGVGNDVDQVFPFTLMVRHSGLSSVES
jgi:hypothetical protein